MTPQLTLLLYLVVPLWLLAGLADWLCHRRAEIAVTSGAPESALHIVLLLEMGIPLLGALYLEVNALIFCVLIGAFVAHEVTSYVDVRYAMPRRHVGVFEQLVHSVLEMSPLIVILLLATAHWSQWLALFDMGEERARFDLAASSQSPSAAYTVALFAAVVFVAALPYAEELVRGLRRKSAVLND